MKPYMCCVPPPPPPPPPPTPPPPKLLSVIFLPALPPSSAAAAALCLDHHDSRNPLQDYGSMLQATAIRGGLMQLSSAGLKSSRGLLSKPGKRSEHVRWRGSGHRQPPASRLRRKPWLLLLLQRPFRQPAGKCQWDCTLTSATACHAMPCPTLPYPATFALFRSTPTLRLILLKS